MQTLREYLQENYQIPNHRDTEEFCLEMLKTLKSNNEYHQQRSEVWVTMFDVMNSCTQLRQSIDKMELFMNKFLSMYKKGEI
jgi:hypothetical protein